MKFYEQPIIHDLDISKQNKNTIRIEVKLQKYLKEKGKEKIKEYWENEKVEKKDEEKEEVKKEKFQKYWYTEKEEKYSGKLLLGKNIILDLSHNYDINFEKNLKKESYKGEIESLKCFLKKNMLENKFFIGHETVSDELYLYFSYYKKNNINNFENEDIKISVTFVN